MRIYGKTNDLKMKTKQSCSYRKQSGTFRQAQSRDEEIRKLCQHQENETAAMRRAISTIRMDKSAQCGKCNVCKVGAQESMSLVKQLGKSEY